MSPPVDRDPGNTRVSECGSVGCSGPQISQYDHTLLVEEHVSPSVAEQMQFVNKHASMRWETEFLDVKVKDYSPSTSCRCCGCSSSAIVADAGAFLHQKHWRYVAVTANKPGPRTEAAKTE
ncbi:uncharacterized protein THITE_2086349 [Thermothielavioides terrestris NRRL 8126]|uniref:Uncharacterized protein n=1 Tax=Thermothielavioides terrestris (strain ATCC 38088 / NRRL 8126) TaxID=578455 RepID=G2R1C4_THETT|nr:uncharacterized protein THITE_2086349 [Thermothielavioides terrestris NRRL 8126]AEO64859.1 hypothetical protein THITE_2086349 [Thermothielavioides terrestris NRRL 8126]